MTPPTVTPPRYVPTLTEVVNLPPSSTLIPATEGPKDSSDAEQDVVERIIQRLMPVMQIKLREIVASVIHEEIRAMEPRLMQEVESMARQTVSQALAQDVELNQV
jgi:hypothetical protein